MQAQFLDKSFLKAISSAYGSSVHAANAAEIKSKNLEQVITTEVDFETKSNSVIFQVKTYGAIPRVEFKEWADKTQLAGEPIPEFAYFGPTQLSRSHLNAHIDRLGSGEPFPPIWSGTRLEYNVTIVPVIGDNYPEILRDIKKNSIPGSNPILFYIEYDGKIHIDTVTEIFNHAGVSLLVCHGVSAYRQQD